MASKCKLGFVKYADLNIDLSRNPRDSDNYRNIESLASDIASNGIITPILVSLRPDGTLHLLRGHRRMLATGLLEKMDAKRFAEVGAKIPATIYEGLTISEEVDLILDHSSQENLTRKSEMYRTVAALLRNGFSEMAVAIKCDGLFVRMAGKEPEGRINALKLADITERAAALLSCWRGRIQEIHNVMRLPESVETYWLHQNGLPDPDGAYKCPKLTTTRTQDLWKAHQADQKSQSVDGALFQKKWDRFVEEDKAKATGNAEPKAKRLSGGDIEDRRMLYRSNAVRGALGLTLGEEVDLDGLDRISAIAEKVHKADNAFWQTVVARYDEIRKEEAAIKQPSAEIIREG